MGNVVDKLKKYLKNEDGNFAIMFAIIVSLLTFGVAAAIEITALYKAKIELQSNLDGAAMSAVIAVAQGEYPEDDDDDDDDDDDVYKSIVLASLEANGYNLEGANPTVILKNESLYVEIKKPYQSYFGGILKKRLSVRAASEISLPSKADSAVEVALVLDNTNSMDHEGKLTALKAGAISFIDAIEESDSGSTIGIVPFSRYVRVPMSSRNASWIDIPAEYDTDRTWQQATHSGQTCETVTRTRNDDGFTEEYQTQECTGGTTTYETQSTVIESRWDGCVGVRRNGLQLQDGPYTSGPTKIPGLLDVIPKEVTGFSWDVKSWCPREITSLTDNFDKLRSDINGQWATDYTYIPAGLSWGRRILSPEVPYDEIDTVNPKRKVLVLMTDGKNTGFVDNTAGIQFYNAPPYIDHLDADDIEDGAIATTSNTETAELCEAIKSEGTEIYTIAFKIDNNLTKNLLKNCASSPSKYFDANSNQRLIQSFAKISKSVESTIRVLN